MTAPRCWSVTLSFAPPGPLHATLTLAPDRESAVALAVLALMQSTPTDAQLHAVLASEVPAETLRSLLRAVDGKLPTSGTAEIVRMVDMGEVVGSLHHRLVPRDGPADGEGEVEAMRGQALATACYHGTSFDLVCRECLREQTHHQPPELPAPA